MHKAWNDEEPLRVGDVFVLSMDLDPYDAKNNPMTVLVAVSEEFFLAISINAAEISNRHEWISSCFQKLCNVS